MKKFATLAVVVALATAPKVASAAPQQCEGQQCAPPTTVTPEPATYALMAAGLLGVGFMARRRNKK